MTQVVLMGNPNCGKTTIFNALTGKTQRVGNWPGVTVEKKTGTFSWGVQSAQLIDLPGIYSLSLAKSSATVDEQIAAKALRSDEVDVIVNVLDASHLERHLYLTTQLLELGKPVVLALNMMDTAKRQHITIDTNLLSETLGCPVIPMQANRKQGIIELQQAIQDVRTQPSAPLKLSLTPDLQATIKSLTHQVQAEAKKLTYQQANYLVCRKLEGDTVATEGVSCVTPADADIAMADARYQAVHELRCLVQEKASDRQDYITAKIDRIVLHRFFAVPLFFGVMYCMFLFAINIGGGLQEIFDEASNAIFVQGFSRGLSSLHAPDWLIGILAYGVGKGINTVVTFIPVIAAMYFFLALLETSGYMARVAFIVDKVMRFLGLPGKAFVPMIVGFGCNVPAVMAARTMDSTSDRLLTVLMSPFMSCSARLAIYAVFVAMFFPDSGHNIVFSLYLVGILMAVLTGLLLRKTLFKGQASPFMMELPAYHRPSIRRLTRETMRRLRYFIVRAAKIIIPVCVILGTLNSITIQGHLVSDSTTSLSLLAWMSQKITPLFSPMGLQAENWPATVGLVVGMLAKEVVIGTLQMLYAQMGHATLESAQYFDGKIGAYAYLLFILLYIPCVSTMAAIRQEAGRRLMWFSVTWSLVLAYAVSVSFYQLATAAMHPLQSCFWLCSMIIVLVMTVRFYAYRLSDHREGLHVIQAS